MAPFILLCIAVAMFFILRRYMQMRREHRLRDNPPKRRVIEVSLPRGIDDADRRTRKVFRTVANLVAGSKSEREAGLKQLDIVYLAEVPHGRTMVDIRYLIYVCVDDKTMDAVKRAFKNGFVGIADIIELKEDPLAEIAAQLRPPAPAEHPEAAPVAAGDGPDDE